MANDATYTDLLITLMEKRLHGPPSPQYIFHEHTVETQEIGRQKGDTIRVIGPEFPAEVSNPDTDRTFTNLSDKVADVAVQDFDLNKQEIQLTEYLLKSAYQIKEYDWMHSVHDVERINGAMVAEDYFKWRDAKIRKRFEENTFRTFGPTDAAGLSSMHATNDAATSSFFIRQVAVLSNRFIPTFADGNYHCIIGPDIKAKLFTEELFQTNTIRALQDRAPVYTNDMGAFGGVRFIWSNNMKVVTGGTSPTFNVHRAFMFGTSLLGYMPLGTADELISQERLDFLRGFGAGPVIKVEGMPVEVRTDAAQEDYGRFKTAIWIEHSEYKNLDPDPTGNGAYSGKVVGTDSRFAQVLYVTTP
jgi:hypothetical protein